eukprot:scaffold7738_cov107-Isochrysis_galbana.AAC.23
MYFCYSLQNVNITLRLRLAPPPSTVHTCSRKHKQRQRQRMTGDDGGGPRQTWRRGDSGERRCSGGGDGQQLPSHM